MHLQKGKIDRELVWFYFTISEKACLLLSCFGPLHNRPGVVSALEEFKLSVYGDHYDEESEGKASGPSKKRKAFAENAVKECANYDWGDLADNGQVKLRITWLFCSDIIVLSGSQHNRSVVKGRLARS